MCFKEQVLNKLESIYGKQDFKNFFDMLQEYDNLKFSSVDRLSENNIYLITYGDAIYTKGCKTILTLKQFLDKYLKEVISDVHILPMFEYTSDDGFSVVDYRKINPILGDWNDINTLSKDYRLMYDFVANHVSKSSEWFKGYLEGNKKYQDYFIEFDEKYDYSQFIRPRTSPLFHDYNGKKALTTFSEDQIDLNFHSLKVLEETTRVLLDYAYQGATSIRLDAIGFIWKETGTGSMHLKNAHEIVKLWRLILDHYKPNCQIITETNVPHLENISYFGQNDEANMVYQFALPPLVLFTFINGTATKLTNWAKTINKVSDNATYFNFLSSHDGIGVRPTEGILSDQERETIFNRVLENHGKISYKNNPDGTTSVYELNINYHDALVDNHHSLDFQIKTILAANAILLSMIGVPAIYYHSLLGSRNDYKGVEESGINRRINREKLELANLENSLVKDDRRKAIFENLKEMIKVRKEQKAFNPYANQKINDISNKIFSVTRGDEEKVTLFVNVTSEVQEFTFSLQGKDLMKEMQYQNNFKLAPYEFIWVKHE